MSEDKNKKFVDQFCVKIHSTNRLDRQNVLKQFIELIEHQVDKDDAPAIFNKTYLQILRCYSDQFETIRSRAITVIGELLERLPASDCYLEYIVPIINRRIACEPCLEGSEEVRLQLLEQLEALIIKYADPDNIRGNPLHNSYDDLVDILIKTLTDPFPTAQKQSCEMVKLLSVSTPSMHFRAEALIDPTILVLSHRHSGNRAAGVEALGALMLHINSKPDDVLKIFGAITPLLKDNVPFVRRACGRVGSMLLMELRDRYSFFHRILPLVLCCLTDENAEVREDIQPRWKAAGEQYYEENETELANLKLIDKIPPNYPPGLERPTLPCRAIVQRSLRIVSVVLKEMTVSKEGIKLHSLRLLKTIILHAEKTFCSVFMEVNVALCKVCMDEDKAIAAEAVEVAQLCAVLLDYNMWNQHVLTEFRKWHTEGNLKCLIAMYGAADSDRLQDLSEVIKLLSSFVAVHRLIDHYQEQLPIFCGILVEDYHRVFTGNEEANTSAAMRDEALLYTMLIKIIALTCENAKDIRNHAMEALTKLNPSIDTLHERHMRSFINNLENLDSVSSDSAESVMLLAGIVCEFGFSKIYHAPLKSAIGTALVHTIPQGKVKLFSAISKGMLQWCKTMRVSPHEQYLLLRDFIDDILSPYLQWDAGSNSETVRTMVVTCLYSMSLGVEPTIFSKIVESFLMIIQGLAEDSNATTRSYAVLVLTAAGPTHLSVLRNIASVVLTRLDDPSNEVRQAAAQCLGSMELAKEYEDDYDRLEKILRPILPTMFLHLENPDEKVRAAMLRSIEKLNARHPALIKELSNEQAAAVPYKAKLEQIIGRSVEKEQKGAPSKS